MSFEENMLPIFHDIKEEDLRFYLDDSTIICNVSYTSVHSDVQRKREVMFHKDDGFAFMVYTLLDRFRSKLLPVNVNNVRKTIELTQDYSVEFKNPTTNYRVMYYDIENDDESRNALKRILTGDSPYKIFDASIVSVTQSYHKNQAFAFWENVWQKKKYTPARNSLSWLQEYIQTRSGPGIQTNSDVVEIKTGVAIKDYSTNNDTNDGKKSQTNDEDDVDFTSSSLPNSYDSLTKDASTLTLTIPPSLFALSLLPPTSETRQHKILEFIWTLSKAHTFISGILLPYLNQRFDKNVLHTSERMQEMILVANRLYFSVIDPKLKYYISQWVRIGVQCPAMLYLFRNANLLTDLYLENKEGKRRDFRSRKTTDSSSVLTISTRTYDSSNLNTITLPKNIIDRPSTIPYTTVEEFKENVLYKCNNANLMSFKDDHTVESLDTWLRQEFERLPKSQRTNEDDKLKLINEGAMGKIYKFGSNQVVKVINTNNNDRMDPYKQAELEFEANIPNLMHQSHVCTSSGKCTIVDVLGYVSLFDKTDKIWKMIIFMNFIKGRDGLDIMNLVATGDFTWTPNMWIENLYCLFLDAQSMHEDLRMLHRDIKLSNVFFDDSNQLLYLGDFGLSRFYEGTEIKDKRKHNVLRQIHGVQGTPKYYSIDMRKVEKNTIGSDVYALAITFMQLINGESFVASEEELKKIINYVDNGWDEKNDFQGPWPPSWEQVSSFFDMYLRNSFKFFNRIKNLVDDAAQNKSTPGNDLMVKKIMYSCICLILMANPLSAKPRTQMMNFILTSPIEAFTYDFNPFSPMIAVPQVETFLSFFSAKISPSQDEFRKWLYLLPFRDFNDRNDGYVEMAQKRFKKVMDDSVKKLNLDYETWIKRLTQVLPSRSFK